MTSRSVGRVPDSTIFLLRNANTSAFEALAYKGSAFVGGFEGFAGVGVALGLGGAGPALCSFFAAA